MTSPGEDRRRQPACASAAHAAPGRTWTPSSPSSCAVARLRATALRSSEVVPTADGAWWGPHRSRSLPRSPLGGPWPACLSCRAGPSEPTHWERTAADRHEARVKVLPRGGNGPNGPPWFRSGSASRPAAPSPGPPAALAAVAAHPPHRADDVAAIEVLKPCQQRTARNSRALRHSCSGTCIAPESQR